MKLKRCKYAFVLGVVDYAGLHWKIAFYCKKVVNFGNKKRSHYDYLHSDILYQTKDINCCLHGYRPCGHYEGLEVPSICCSAPIQLVNGLQLN